MAKWKIEGEYSRSPSEMVKEFMSVTEQVVDPILYEGLIVEEFREWQVELQCTTTDLKELADLVYVCYGYAEACGYDLDEALVRVHQNNVGRCIQPDGTVHRRADGKIIKNPDYPKVQLEDII
jgi:predicted HAD superfamily Cof-like phosphohydrolase